MKKITAVFLALLPVVVSCIGCAPMMKVNIPKESPLFEIGPLKGVPEIHARSILFVNNSHFKERCLIFEGGFSYEMLFKEGKDGLPELMVVPIGFFEIDPPVLEGVVSEQLVGYFEPLRAYTVLCFSENIFFGGVVDIKTINVRTRGKAEKSLYRYTNAYGLKQGKFVNQVVFLPRYTPLSRGSGNTVSLRIDLNELLHRFIHRITSHSDGPDVKPMSVPMCSVRIAFPEEAELDSLFKDDK